MIEHDSFLDIPVHRQALTYLLDGIFDGNGNLGLQQLAQQLPGQDFMEVVPEGSRSTVACLAAKRARDVLDDVMQMEACL